MQKLLTGSLFALLLGTSPIAVLETPAHAQAIIRVRVAPPAPRVEVIPVAPTPRHVWVPGHWGWNGVRHNWVAGYYDLPPHPGYHWTPAHWASEGGVWVFRNGYWAPNAPEQPVAETEAYVVPNEPPPPQAEVIPAPPQTGMVWLPGYHRWDPLGRRYIWTPGRYQLGEPGRTWIPAHWARTWRGWEFQPGHWRGHYNNRRY